MRIRRAQPRPRVAFVFEASRTVHVPTRCEWADARRVEVHGGDWREACQQLASEPPDVVVAFDPGEGADALAAVPALRIAIVLDARRGGGTTAAHRSGAIDAFTWPERWAGDGEGPFQILPPPLDDALVGAAPALAARAVLLAGWAPPDRDVRARLGTDVRTLPPDATVERVLAAAEDAAALLWCVADAILPADPRLVAALSRGALVVANAPPPHEWALDVGDDLVVCAPAEMPEIVSRALADPLLYAPVRVRAWQRVRESFSTAALERLVHDALGLLPRRHAAALEGRP